MAAGIHAQIITVVADYARFQGNAQAGSCQIASEGASVSAILVNLKLAKGGYERVVYFVETSIEVVMAETKSDTSALVVGQHVYRHITRIVGL